MSTQVISELYENCLNMWYVIIITIFSVLVVTITILNLKGRRKRILADKIPGPNGSFVIGNLPLFTQEPEIVVKNLLREYRIHEKSLFKMWLFNRLFIILTKPEDIEKVLKSPKCLKKSNEYKVFQECVGGRGIFSNNNINEWKHNRKLVIKGLGLAKLKSLIPSFYQESKVLVEIIQKNCDLKPNDCDINKPISMATMEMIGKSALGVTFNAQRDGQHEFVSALHTIFQVCAYRIFHPWFINSVLFHFSPFKRGYDQYIKFVVEFVDSIIKTKIAKSSQIENSADGNVDGENVNETPKTILEILLQNSHEMSLKQIRDEIVTIMTAGQDTVAVANALTVFMLAHHQDVQNKVFEESQSIFLSGDYERVPTYDDLQQMNYLERVIKETLRLLPSAPLFARSLEEDMEIGGHLCPAGATLVFFPIFLQTSPLYYTDPNKFNPDNFLPDVCEGRHPFTYIPFSGGLRSCIGGKYAMLQMKTILSTLVRKLKFFPSDRCPKPENIRVVFPITLKFIDGCHVKIETRI